MTNMDIKELVSVFSTHATEVEDLHNTHLMAFVEENPWQGNP